MKYETTAPIREALNEWCALRDALPEVMKIRRFWERRIHVSEQIEMLKAVAHARSVLERTLFSTFQSVGATYEVNTKHVDDGVAEASSLVAAVDPHVGSTGNPTTRDGSSSSSSESDAGRPKGTP